MAQRLDWLEPCTRRLMVGLHLADEDQFGGEYHALRRAGTIPALLERFEPTQLVRALQRAHVQAFWFYSKGGFGNAIYPSRCGHVLSVLRGRDLFGELCDACLRHGIVPLGIYECSDLRIRAEHPEWCHLPVRLLHEDGDRGQERTDSEIGKPCVLGPYGDLVIAQTVEVLRAYPIRAYYLDALSSSGPGGRLCRHCAQAFAERFGFPYPGLERLEHAQSVAFVRWQIRRLGDFARKVQAIVRRERPDLAFTYNYIGVPDACDFISCDLFSGREGTLAVDTWLRRNAALSPNHPAEVLLDGVHDDVRTTKALDSYRAEMWTARALNVAACGSYVQSMDGALPVRELALIREVFAEQARYEEWLVGMRVIRV